MSRDSSLPLLVDEFNVVRSEVGFCWPTRDSDGKYTVDADIYGIIEIEGIQYEAIATAVIPLVPRPQASRPVGRNS